MVELISLRPLPEDKHYGKILDIQKTLLPEGLKLLERVNPTLLKRKPENRTSEMVKLAQELGLLDEAHLIDVTPNDQEEHATEDDEAQSQGAKVTQLVE